MKTLHQSTIRSTLPAILALLVISILLHIVLCTGYDNNTVNLTYEGIPGATNTLIDENQVVPITIAAEDNSTAQLLNKTTTMSLGSTLNATEPAVTTTTTTADPNSITQQLLSPVASAGLLDHPEEMDPELLDQLQRFDKSYNTMIYILIGAMTLFISGILLVVYMVMKYGVSGLLGDDGDDEGDVTGDMAVVNTKTNQTVSIKQLKKAVDHHTSNSKEKTKAKKD